MIRNRRPVVPFYFDEDVSIVVAKIIRAHGFKVICASEVKECGITDEEQLKYAAKNNYVLVTHNIRDFCLLAREWAKKEKMHSGIILSRQVHFSKLLPATIKLLGISREQSIQNQVIWLKI